MRKIRIYALGLCLLAMSSCKDDDKGFLNVGKDGETSIECNNLDQIVEIPIESSDSWVASLPEDCEWATILTTEGRNGALRLVVDMNWTSEFYQAIRRTTTVTVKCGDQTREIGLIQFAGASASDPGSNSDEGLLCLNKGVGLGFNLLTSKNKGQVFNVNVISDFKEDEEIKQSFRVAPVIEGTTQILAFDSLESKKDTIAVSLSLNISYGSFKVEASGRYQSYEKKASDNFKYGQVAVLPRAEAKLDVFNLVAKYQENEEAAGTPEYSKSIEAIFASGFRRPYNNLIKVHAKYEMNKDNEDPKDKSKAAFQSAVRALVDNFGPVVVMEATLGGQVSMKVQADTSNVTDVMNIAGKAKVAFQSMVSIEANAEIKYGREGTSLLQHSFINCYVQGGSRAANAKVTDALVRSSSEMNSKSISDAVAEWRETVIYDNNQYNNQTEAVEYEFTGIWNLFPYNMAEDIRLVILEMYKGKESMLDIEKLLVGKPLNP